MTFSIADQVFLAHHGIDDVALLPGGPTEDPAMRVLQAAWAGQLLGPDLTSWREVQLPVRAWDVEPTLAQSRAITEALETGDLVWIGTRLALTAQGRERLARWADVRERDDHGRAA